MKDRDYLQEACMIALSSRQDNEALRCRALYLALGRADLRADHALGVVEEETEGSGL